LTLCADPTAQLVDDAASSPLAAAAAGVVTAHAALPLQELQHVLCAADLQQQLQLAFNTAASQPADALTAQLLSLREQPMQLRACLAQLHLQDDAQQLLSTALLRRHFSAAVTFEGLLCTSRPEWSFLQTVAAALNAAVQQQDGGAVACLCKLQSSQQLPEDTVTSLLLHAMQLEDTAAVAHLSGLSAAAQLSVGSAVQLLQAALQHDFSDLVTFVCEQQAAQQIEAGAMTSLLLAAVQQLEAAQLEELLLLQPAQMLHAPAVQQLLQAAIDAAAASEDADTAAVQLLVEELPAVHELDKEQVAVLLRYAMNQTDELSRRLVTQLLPLQPSCLVQLLTEALQQKRVNTVNWLCSAAKSTGAAAAVSKRSCERLLLLANQQAVLHKVAKALLTLLPDFNERLFMLAVSAAVKAGDAQSVTALAGDKGLPRKYRAEWWPYVHGWLADAAARHQQELAAALCKLGVRQPLPVDGCLHIYSAATLLQRAVDAKDCAALSILLKVVLDSGNICTVEQASQAVLLQMQGALKQAVFSRGDVDVLRCLAGSRAAEGVDACSMTGLLWWTLQHGQHEQAAVLLELQCAQRCVSSCQALQRAVRVGLPQELLKGGQGPVPEAGIC
jgi:hypothetical protein